MEMVLTARCTPSGQPTAPDPGPGHEVRVRIRPGVTVSASQLARKLAGLLGCAGDSLLIDNVAVPDDALVGLPPLLNGAHVLVTTITSGYAGSPAPAYPTDARLGVVDLAVVSGPDCGHRRALTPAGVSIGRAADRLLVIDDPGISRAHATVRVEPSGVTLVDGGSTNGTSVDGVALRGRSTTITTAHRIRLGSTVFRLLSPPPRQRGHPLGNGRLRPPAPTWQAQRVEPIRLTMPTRPTAPTATPLPWLAMLIPVPIAAVLAYFFGPHFLLLAAMGPLTMGASWGQERRRQRSRHRTEVTEYDAARTTLLQQAADALGAERRRLEHDHPSPVEILDTAIGTGPLLWSRRPGCAEAPGDGPVRLGIGTVPARTLTVAGENPATARMIEQAPVIADWEKGLVVHGPRHRVEAVLRQVVGQIVTVHDPADLNVLLLAPDHNAHKWHWLRPVPHWQASARSCTQLLRMLDDRLASNTPAAQTSSRQPHRTQLLVVPDLAAAMQQWPELVRLLEHGCAVGMPVIAGSPDASDAHVPPSLPQLRIASDGSAVLRRPDAHDQELIADGVGLWWARRLAHHLARLQSIRTPDHGHEGGRDVWALHGIPAPDVLEASGGVDLRTAGVTAPTAAREGILSRWTSSLVRTRAAGGAPRPTALIGHQGGRPWSIDLVEDGPHVLVGGTTGSGKSEFLRALVLGLALDAPAEAVTFLLIDYKGGSAFGRCAELPHTVGLITDLDPMLARRALTSLRAEIQHRERLLATHGAADLDDYWSLPPNADRPALPRLVVVIDEFRVLAQEQPDFVAGIVRCAAVGRSLGVHLVLATQRPSGVITPDIAANVNLRVALRMRDAADSEQVIGSKVSATIDPSRPGVGWARHGSGTLEEFRAVRVSAPITPPRPEVEVELVGSAGAGLHSQTSTATAAKVVAGATDEGVLVEAIRAAHAFTGAPTPRPPWLPPLPADLGFGWWNAGPDADAAAPEKAAEDAAAGIRAPLGLVDDPAQQAQRVLWWRAEDPPWRFIGGSASGKTTALVGLVHRLAELFGPDRLHVYAVDGADGLACLAALPQVGAVVGPDEVGRLRQLGRRIEDELASRRLARPSHDLLVVVDEWDRLTRPGAPTQEVVDKLISTAMDGRGLGLHVVAAGGHLLAGARLWRGGGVVCLGGTDPADLLLLGGRPSDLSAEAPPGRGLLPEARLEVQLGPAGLPLRAAPLGTNVRAAGPAPIVDLPRQLHWRSLAGHPTGRGAGDPGREMDRFGAERSPGGLATSDEDGDLSLVGPWLGQGHEGPVRWRPRAWGRQLLVVGPAGSGRTTALRTLAESAEASGRHTVVLSSRPDQWASAWSGEDADRVRAVLVAHLRALVLVDDLDTMGGTSIEALVAELSQSAKAHGGLLAVSVRQHTLSTAFRGPVPLLAQRQTALLLMPTTRHDGDAVGLRIDLPAVSTPGRGVLVVRGQQEEVQVAQPTPSAPDGSRTAPRQVSRA